MYIGKVSLTKLLETFVNAHGSSVIPPVMTSILRRGGQGYVDIFLHIFILWLLILAAFTFLSSPMTLALQQCSAAPGRPGAFGGLHLL